MTGGHFFGRGKPTLTLAVTGNLGSGKSEVLKSFKKLGAQTFDCDQIARELTGGARTWILRRVAVLLGSEVFDNQGRFDRAAAARLVFSKPPKRRALEALLHPLILRELLRRLRISKNPLRAVEAPLLFESEQEHFFDAVLVVRSGDRVIRKRLKKKGWGPGEIRARLAAQMPLKEKCRKADFILDNNGTYHEIHRQVKGIHQACQIIIKNFQKEDKIRHDK
ncbi:MAG: dephospho-CoA kinase [Elusimicrobiota bacterium]